MAAEGASASKDGSIVCINSSRESSPRCPSEPPALVSLSMSRFVFCFFLFRSPFLLFGASVLSAFGLQQVTERRRTAGVPDEADLSAAPGQDDGRKRSEAERVLVAGSHKGQRKTGRYHYPRITFQEKKTPTRKILHGASHFLRQCRKQVVQRIQ